MKPFLFIATAFIIALASCHKDADVRENITGNWNLVSDSTYSSGIGPNGTPSHNKYTGVAGDHFDFTPTGKLYIKEGGVKIDTADYSIEGTDTLKLKYDYFYEGGVTITGAVGGFLITTLTGQTLVLANNFLTPGGRIYEQIDLRR